MKMYKPILYLTTILSAYAFSGCQQQIPQEIKSIIHMQVDVVNGFDQYYLSEVTGDENVDCVESILPGNVIYASKEGWSGCSTIANTATLDSTMQREYTLLMKEKLGIE